MTPQLQYRLALQSQTRKSVTWQTKTQINDFGVYVNVTKCICCFLQDLSSYIRIKSKHLIWYTHTHTHTLGRLDRALLFYLQKWKALGRQEGVLAVSAGSKWDSEEYRLFLAALQQCLSLLPPPLWPPHQTFFRHFFPTFLYEVLISQILHIWKWKLLSRVRLFAAPWTVAYQAPLSLEFSRQEYWSG